MRPQRTNHATDHAKPRRPAAARKPPTRSGFKLPGQQGNTAPDDALPKTAPDTATSRSKSRRRRDQSQRCAAARHLRRDLAIGGAAILVLLVIYFFVRNAYVHHLVVRRVAPSSAGSAGWLMFVGLSFLSAAAVLAMVNAAKYLTLAVTGPLVAVGLVALVAALFVGRR
jgi:hypothetical protein